MRRGEDPSHKTQGNQLNRRDSNPMHAWEPLTNFAVHVCARIAFQAVSRRLGLVEVSPCPAMHHRHGLVFLIGARGRFEGNPSKVVSVCRRPVVVVLRVPSASNCKLQHPG